MLTTFIVYCKLNMTDVANLRLPPLKNFTLRQYRGGSF